LVVEHGKIEQEAGHWVAREDRGLSEEERLAFSAWLESAAHRVAYLRLKSSWEKTGRLAALRGSLSLRDRWALFPSLRYVLAAASILLLAGAAFAVMRVYELVKNTPTQEVVYATQAGERPTIHLVDGTQIQLDANSRLRATVSTAERMVTLEKGEAYFEVTHDADRPFVVIAGKHRISDLGTKFSVLRDGDEVRVVVSEGRVKVDNVDTLSPEKPIFADGGNIVVAKADETLLTPTTQQDISDDLGWRDGRLIFNQRSLADAAREFNRYNSRKIVVTGDARDIKIGGSFRADNMDVFVNLIKNSLGLAAEDQGNTIVLSKK
jgi:transmembrane sensor